jgi:hypothetical protein
MADSNNKKPEPTRPSRDILRTLARQLFDPYRPELHYMRGPGPKWHEQHASAASAATTTVVFGPDAR